MTDPFHTHHNSPREIITKSNLVRKKNSNIRPLFPPLMGQISRSDETMTADSASLRTNFTFRNRVAERSRRRDMEMVEIRGRAVDHGIDLTH